MPRIKLEESLLSDGRFIATIQKIGQTRAFGDYVRLCFLAQNFWKRDKKLIPKKIYEDQGFPEEFVVYNLVEEREKGYYVKGSNKHFSWLFERPDSTTKLADKVAKKNSESKPKQISLDFLDDDLQQFIAGVSDTMRRRWVKNYSPETITTQLENCMEWCNSVNKVPKNVGLLMNKFFEGVAKDAAQSCPLDEDVQSALDGLMSEGRKDLGSDYVKR